jgi:predicted HAD superfamily Cof-like phosphohydrolase
LFGKRKQKNYGHFSWKGNKLVDCLDKKISGPLGWEKEQIEDCLVGKELSDRRNKAKLRTVWLGKEAKKLWTL